MSQYRHRRTSNPATAFPSPLEPGEIAVNTSNRQLAVGDASSATIGNPVPLIAIRAFDARAMYAAGDLAVEAGVIFRALVNVSPGAFTPAQWEAISGALLPQYVQKAGDTMSGPLTLAADPTAALQAATKQYADTKLALAGGTLTGPLTLAADPAAALQSATKQYVDGAVAQKAQVFVSDTPPVGVPDNSLWWESDSGQLYVRYNDGDSTQWVVASPAPDLAVFVQKSGDTMTGALTLPGNPTSALQAAPKQYVDGLYTGALTLTDTQKAQARANIYAAPFDALAYNGMQINANMDISQERGTATVSVSSTSRYIVDGWQLTAAGSVVVSGVQQSTSKPAGYSNALQAYPTTAVPSLGSTDFCAFVQPIEGYRIARLAWGTANAQPLSVGFWILSQRIGTYSVAVRNAAGTRNIVQPFTINASNTWEYKTVTFPGDTAGAWNSDNTKGLELWITIAAGLGVQGAPGVWVGAGIIAVTGQVNAVAATSDSTVITGVVVLPGLDVPSAARAPFIVRPADQELLICLRYYSYNKDREPGFLESGANTTAQTYVFNHTARVPFRATPTVALVGTSVAIECMPWASAATMTGVTINSSGHFAVFGGDYSLIGTMNVAQGASNGLPATLSSMNQIKYDARL